MTIDPDVLAALERAEYEAIKAEAIMSWGKLLADQANRIAALEAEVVNLRSENAQLRNLRELRERLSRSILNGKMQREGK
jgi:hypothetical protein